jgi:hypothetical protein
MLFQGASGKIPTEFFTRDSIFTFTGITGATFVIANGIQTAFDWNPKWLALLLAEILCLLGVYIRGTQGSVDMADYALGFVNGFLVFCTVAGATTGASKVAGPGTSQVVDRGGAKRGFFTPWF